MKKGLRLSIVGFAVLGLILTTTSIYAQRTAAGTAILFKTFVILVDVTDGGAGYVTPPTVSFIGGGGQGAVAVATITNGVVTGVTVTDAGTAYTSTPGVVFSAPPPPTTLALRLAPLLTVVGAPNTLVEIQYYDSLGDTTTWLTLTNVTLTGSPWVWCDTGAIPGTRFYRVIDSPIPANPDPVRLAWINPGSFIMGSPATEQDRNPYEVSEGPQTQVTLTRGFYMGKYEVTQGEYAALIGNNPSYFHGDTNLPVETVNWNHATNYCAKLTAREVAAGRLPPGWNYRLPTEAEWEYACRAGTTTRFSFGDDPTYSLVGQYAWYRDNANSRTHPVGTKLPNPWGLFDMYGNVAEWCLDWYNTIYPGGNVVDPQGPVSASDRSIRNSNWEGSNITLRSAQRIGRSANHIWFSTGFRVVLAPTLP